MEVARQRERQLKDWSRAKKEALVATKNLDRRDLFDEMVSNRTEV